MTTAPLARAAALAGAPDVDEVSLLELLLGDIRDIFDTMPDDLLDPKAQRISSAELIEKLCKIEPRPWSEYGKPPKEITQNKLARLLRAPGIAPQNIRSGSDVVRGYYRHQFEDAFERYLASEGVSNRYSATNADSTGDRGELKDIVRGAVIGAFDTFDIGDSGWLVDLFCDRFQKIITNDRRFPRLTNLEFDLLIADVRRDVEHICARQADLNYRHATRAIVEDVLAELQPKEPPFV